MLILSVFIFFSTIFVLMYENSNYKFKMHYPQDMLKSIAWYARALGYVPKNEDLKYENQIPYASIGISDTFFKTKRSQKGNYKILNDAYLDKNLLQIDSLHWIMQKFGQFGAFQLKMMKSYYYENNVKSFIHIPSTQENKYALMFIFELARFPVEINVNKDMLCHYAGYETSYIDLVYNFSQEEEHTSQKKYYVYPNSKAMVITAAA